MSRSRPNEDMQQVSSWEGGDIRTRGVVTDDQGEGEFATASTSATVASPDRSKTFSPQMVLPSSSLVKSVTAAERRKKRRVPEDRRQRTEISCDRCKTRKIRCIRLPDQSGNPACAACLQLSLQCKATIPRKQRAPTNHESLDTKFQALEMLAEAAFPDLDVGNTEEILSLARRCKSQAADKSRIGARRNDHERQTHAGSLYTPSEGVGALNIPEGRLIPAPRSGYHYVGPASSYQFANTLRCLVTKSQSTLLVDRRKRSKAEEFASADRTTALEARIHDHPVMIAGGDDMLLGHQDDIATSTSRGECEGTPWSPNGFSTPGTSMSSRLRTLSEVLPDRDLADSLVDTFFTRVHPNFNLLHRGSFQARYDSMWLPESAEMTQAEPGWMCVVFLIFVLGAQALERDDFSEAIPIQRRFLTIVIRAGLSRLVLTATLSNVQALMLLSLYQHNSGERNTAWMLAGQSIRMAIALGMQRDGENGNFDHITRNTRRLVWWTLYLFEQHMSFVLGRPSASDLVDITTSLPEETVLDGGNLPPDYLRYTIALAQISSRIKRLTASISIDFDNPFRMHDSVELAKGLQSQLQNWTASLPNHLHEDYRFTWAKHQRIVALLHITCKYLGSILGRPFLLCMIDQNLNHVHSITIPYPPTPSGIKDLALLSLESARACASSLCDLASVGLLEGEFWHDWFYIHHCCLVLSLPSLIQDDGVFDNNSSYRALVSTMLNMAQRSRLAPTYRILINVSIQFAKIVKISPDDDPSRPPSPAPGYRPLGATSTSKPDRARSVVSSFSSSFATESLPSEAYARPGSNIISREPPHPEPFALNNTTNSLNEAHSSQADWSLLPLTTATTPSMQPISLEQLLGIDLLPPTENINGQADGLFSDMYNFGFERGGLPDWVARPDAQMAQTDHTGHPDEMASNGSRENSNIGTAVFADLFSANIWEGNS
ncbi:hypothetical protein V866_005722 [Kwoniella sp. B9012]